MIFGVRRQPKRTEKVQRRHEMVLINSTFLLLTVNYSKLAVRTAVRWNTSLILRGSTLWQLIQTRSPPNQDLGSLGSLLVCPLLCEQKHVSYDPCPRVEASGRVSLLAFLTREFSVKIGLAPGQAVGAMCDPCGNITANIAKCKPYTLNPKSYIQSLEADPTIWQGFM